MTSNPTPHDGEIDSEKTQESTTIVESANIDGSKSTNSSEIEKIEISKKQRAPRKRKTIKTEVAEETEETEVSQISIEKPSPMIVENTVQIQNEKVQNKFDLLVSIYNKFRPTEKLVFILISILFLGSFFTILSRINTMYSVELPTVGGSYTEGIVGYARYINPILGYTDADKDMISLIYSGLLKPTPEGKLIADLAKSWEISEDGLVYTFILKENITFHDGTPLTTDDIEFTVTKAQDPRIKSPRAENWTGVTMEKVSPTEIKFILKKPYAPFLENMTLGILPKHIWSNIDYEAFDINIYNREPIGSGPYKIKKAYRNTTGIYEHYSLIPFEKYNLGTPYIKQLTIKFYKNETEALENYHQGSIEGIGGVSPEEANRLQENQHRLESTPLPRIFGLFFNQNSAPVLVHKEVREALNVSVNRLSLIDTVLQGWGSVSKNAIPRGLSKSTELSSAPKSALSETTSTASNTAEYLLDDQYIEAGKKILLDKGWKLNASGVFEKQTKDGKTTKTETLSFSISTSNVPELKHSAEILKNTWTKLGADVKVEIFEPSDLVQKVIRPRKYDSLLFGNVVGRNLDLYPFWHSSQRNDPGLNIALYTNIKADKVLETIRTTSDETKKIEAYRAFENEIQNDIPAVFLYSPDYIYATSKDIHNLEISNITNPSERFMNIHLWYLETEKVWKIFTK